MLEKFALINYYFDLRIFSRLLLFLSIAGILYIKKKNKTFFGLEENDLWIMTTIGAGIGIIPFFLFKDYIYFGTHLIIFLLGCFILFEIHKNKEFTKKVKLEFPLSHDMSKEDFDNALENTVIYITDYELNTKKYEGILPLMEFKLSYFNQSDETERNIMIRCPVPDNFMCPDGKIEYSENGKQYLVFLIKKLKPNFGIECTYSMCVTADVLGKENHINMESPEYHIFMQDKPDINHKDWLSVVLQNNKKEKNI